MIASMSSALLASTLFGHILLLLVAPAHMAYHCLTHHRPSDPPPLPLRPPPMILSLPPPPPSHLTSALPLTLCPPWRHRRGDLLHSTSNHDWPRHLTSQICSRLSLRTPTPYRPTTLIEIPRQTSPPKPLSKGLPTRQVSNTSRGSSVWRNAPRLVPRIPEMDMEIPLSSLFLRCYDIAAHLLNQHGLELVRRVLSSICSFACGSASSLWQQGISEPIYCPPEAINLGTAWCFPTQVLPCPDMTIVVDFRHHVCMASALVAGFCACLKMVRIKWHDGHPSVIGNQGVLSPQNILPRSNSTPARSLFG